jgi:hypothetical protein
MKQKKEKKGLAIARISRTPAAHTWQLQSAGFGRGRRRQDRSVEVIYDAAVHFRPKYRIQEPVHTRVYLRRAHLLRETAERTAFFNEGGCLARQSCAQGRSDDLPAPQRPMTPFCPARSS